MNNDIYYETTTAATEAMLALLTVVLTIGFILGLIQLVLYVFRSIGLYRLAKRRRLNHPWLAWVPVGCNWIAGGLSDQYQHRVNGRKHWNRLALLLLRVGTICFGTFQGLAGLCVATGLMTDPYSYLGLPLAFQVLCGFLAPVLGLAYFVIGILASYDVYRSCDPSNGLLYTILGAVFRFLHPFFLFALRNRDDGMPDVHRVSPEIL